MPGQTDILHIGGRRPSPWAGMSRRGTAVPTILCSAGSLGATLAVASRCRSTLARELAIADLAAIAAGNDAIAGAQGIDRNPEPLGRELHEYRAHLRAPPSAAPSRWLRSIGCRRSAPHSEVWPVSPEIILRRESGRSSSSAAILRERGEDTLAELHLAGEHGRGAIRIDAQPRIEHAVAIEATRQRRLLAQSEAAARG